MSVLPLWLNIRRGTGKLEIQVQSVAQAAELAKQEGVSTRVGQRNDSDVEDVVLMSSVLSNVFDEIRLRLKTFLTIGRAKLLSIISVG